MFFFEVISILIVLVLLIIAIVLLVSVLYTLGFLKKPESLIVDVEPQVVNNKPSLIKRPETQEDINLIKNKPQEKELEAEFDDIIKKNDNDT